MIPMRNRRSGLVCRGLHKLKKEMAAEKYKAVYKKGWWPLEKVKGKGIEGSDELEEEVKEWKKKIKNEGLSGFGLGKGGKK